MGNQVYLVLLTLSVLVVTTGGDTRRQNRQLAPGISFAIPALQLFGGGLGNNFNQNNNNNNNNNNVGNVGLGGNLFGNGFGNTVTRTLVSTVSTVTTASFRTCTTMAALMPCAGRRKRDVDDAFNEVFMDHVGENLQIEPTASIALIVASTTITDPVAVSEYLAQHQPSPNSIIYPQDITISEIRDIESNNEAILHASDDFPAPTTILPEGKEAAVIALADEGTEALELEQGTTPFTVEEVASEDEKGRVGFGATTVTTIIRVTSVATTLATGMMATLTVSYLGCLPPSLPVSGISC